MGIVLETILFLVILSIPLIVISRSYSGNRRFKAVIYISILIWIARFLVGLFSEMVYENGLSIGETFFDSIIHVFKTFSMDEDYTTYTVAGKELLSQQGYISFSRVYGIIISILNLCAPVLGGALILSIITDTFSHVKVFLFPFRHKFVFSELNSSSITLAEDIVRNDNYKKIIKHKLIEFKPMIIFTDVYLDNQSEISSELFNRAKEIHAVCIKSDLLRLSLKKSKSIDYMLIDEDSKENISTLSSLLKNNTRGKEIWPVSSNFEEPRVRVFVFVQDDFESLMVKSVCEKNKNSQEVTIRTIRDYMNSAINLMYDVPLFIPLLSKEDRNLTITILGGGSIAEEVFKAVFWCGQMVGVNLSINVISDNASLLEKRLRDKCPELIKSCDNNSDILRTKPFGDKSDKNPPYCSNLSFIDVESIFNFIDIPEKIFEMTNYYVIALGTDNKNITIANDLQALITRKSIKNKQLKNCVIAPAVFNKEMAEIIQNFDTEGDVPLIIPFATLESRFSCENIFMINIAKSAGESEELYNKKTQMNVQKDEYSYWANIARAIHAPYKMFGLGAIESIDLGSKNMKRWRCKDKIDISEIQEHELAWIEHRRWNAFMRTQGFVCPTKAEYDTYYSAHVKKGETGMHKDIKLKFHPCLVESQISPTPLPSEKEFDMQLYDYLDFVAMYTYYTEIKMQNAGRLNDKDYKKWDYMEYDAALKRMLSQEGMTKDSN